MRQLTSEMTRCRCFILLLCVTNIIYFLIYRWSKYRISNAWVIALDRDRDKDKFNTISTSQSLFTLQSFARALHIDADRAVYESWPQRQCDFQKGKKCATWNIHHFLASNTNNTLSNENGDKFSILINTWQRNECLIQLVEHYLQCEQVAQIRVIWSDPGNDIPWRLVELQSGLPDHERQRLAFDEYKDDKLSNRFKYNAEWITDALFHTDDDHLYSCALLSNTFKLWRLIPDYMIGFAPRTPHDDYKHEGRIHSKQKQKQKQKVGRKPYQFYHYSTAYKECEYSLQFSTLGGFMHRKYCQMYTHNDMNGVQNAWKTIRNSVDGNITGEDFTMSLLYTYQSGLPPITVIVPESESYSKRKQFVKCDTRQSETMHSNSERKRNEIFMDTLRVLGYYDKPQSFSLQMSRLWLDVMPLSKQPGCNPVRV